MYRIFFVTDQLRPLFRQESVCKGRDTQRMVNCISQCRVGAEPGIRAVLLGGGITKIILIQAWEETLLELPGPLWVNGRGRPQPEGIKIAQRLPDIARSGFQRRWLVVHRQHVGDKCGKVIRFEFYMHIDQPQVLSTSRVNTLVKQQDKPGRYTLAGQQ